jgi:hypothetical protein
MGNVTRTLAGLLIAGALLLAACGTPSVPSPPPGQSPPPVGAVPEVGVLYRVTLFCSEPVVLGATSWSFDQPFDWPPAQPSKDVFSYPYAVLGVVKVISDDKAVFRADVNGSVLTLTKLAGNSNPLSECL